jgi:hypothetical protein
MLVFRELLNLSDCLYIAVKLYTYMKFVLKLFFWAIKKHFNSDQDGGYP